MDIREWADRYPGDPEALQDALVMEIGHLETALRRIASLGEKNVQKYARAIAREALDAPPLTQEERQR